tara:strand:+ start:992 stop:1228 length:237 start_codon:yes stop_codon:yes gene_type:complete
MYCVFSEDMTSRERKFMGGLWFGLEGCKDYVKKLEKEDAWPTYALPLALNLSDDMATYVYYKDIDEWQHCGYMTHETN